MNVSRLQPYQNTPLYRASRVVESLGHPPHSHFLIPFLPFLPSVPTHSLCNPTSYLPRDAYLLIAPPPIPLFSLLSLSLTHIHIPPSLYYLGDVYKCHYPYKTKQSARGAKRSPFYDRLKGQVENSYSYIILISTYWITPYCCSRHEDIIIHL